jgi:hypothetical protein
MAHQPYIDVTGATAYRKATGSGTLADPYVPEFTAVQLGTWNVGISGTLPAFTTIPTFNIGTAPDLTFTNTSFIANAGTNLNTSALALESGGNLASINTKLPNLGQALASGSVPVVLPAAQLTTLTPPTAVGINSGTNTIGSIANISGTVSLPTGAATSALQTTGNNSLSSIDGKIPASLGVKAPSGSISVVQSFAATSTITNVASSATSVILLVANNDRKTVIIVNDSASDLYIVLNASAASTTNFSIFLPARVGNTPSFATFNGDDYSGEIRGIWNSANGFARITEIV